MSTNDNKNGKSNNKKKTDMETIEQKIRFFAEKSANRREYDEHVDNIIEDIIQFGIIYVTREKVFRQDAVDFHPCCSSTVGGELAKVVENCAIRRYFCFDGESEDTVEVPTAEDFRDMVGNAVREFSFDFF